MSLLLPVRYPAKLYSHSDASAPQIANADGAIKTILKACLVTGYGAKAGAGWTALFEDSFQIVLRLPDLARALGSPDLKIENGGGKYRIVTQSNPTGLDDATQLADVSLLSRDTNIGAKWHLVATDVGFVFFYQGAEMGFGVTARDMILYYGAMSMVKIGSPTLFVATEYDASKTTGEKGPWRNGMLHSNRFKNMITNTMLQGRSFLNVGDIPDLDIATRFFIASASCPFLASITSSVDRNIVTKEINGRIFLRVADYMHQNYERRNFYIPIDYWEI